MTEVRQSPGPGGPPAVPGGAFRSAAEPARFEAVLDSLNEIVFETDAVGNWTYLNQAWRAITGFEVEDSLGRHFLEFVHPDEREATIQMFTDVVEGQLDHCHHETRYLTADGSHRWMELRAAVLYDEMGRIDGNAGVILDVSERRQAQEQLAEQSRILELIAKDTSLEETLGALAGLLAGHLGVTVEVDLPPRHHPQATAAPPSPPALRLLGRPDGSLELLPPAAPAPPGPAAETASGELRDARRTVVPILATGGDVQLGTLVAGRGDGELDRDRAALLERCAALAAIAVQRREAAEAADHRALHDPLTGLPNRILYTDRLAQALASAVRHGRRVALLMLDLDHFKTINDTLGHEAGDQVLQEVAGRLTATLRETDTACRLGGDEFAIVLADLADLEAGWRTARRLHERLAQPFDIGGVVLTLQFTMGMAVSSPDGEEPAGLLRRADAAMYRAKRDGEGLILYDPRWDMERLRGINLAGELRRALDEDQFAVHYQPKVDPARGRVVGVEALLRWDHPERGQVSPSLFVPIAETSTVIKPLTLWVLRTALADRRRWRDQGFDVAVAVNLSARILHDVDLPDLVREVLAAEDSTGEDLELEITESALMVDPQRAMQAMGRLAEAGVAFSIDDFGTGYSSLTYLKQLPARSLKIDRSFVRQMDDDERDASIVRSAIDLAHNLGMLVVAEGVERESVVNLLARLGCDAAQGYHIARPMTGDELQEWLRRFHHGPGPGTPGDVSR